MLWHWDEVSIMLWHAVGIVLEHWCHLALSSLAMVLPGAAGSSWGHGAVSPPLSPQYVLYPWEETRVLVLVGCRLGCPWSQLRCHLPIGPFHGHPLISFDVTEMES